MISKFSTLHKRSRLYWLAVCGIIVLAVVIAWKVYPHECLLMDKATRVTQCEIDFDHWYSNDVIILYHRFRKPNPIIERRNIRTGKSLSFVVPYSDLNQKLSLDDISPDGKWIKWVSDDHDNHIVTYNTESHRSNVWQSKWGGGTWWLPDSRRWLEVERASDASYFLIHNVDAINDTQRFAFPQDGIDGDLGQITRDHFLFYHAIHGTRSTEVDSLDIHVFNLMCPKEQWHLCPRLPVNGELREYSFSADGNYIAWLVIRNSSVPHVNWIERLLPTFHLPQQTVQSIWVSQLDGSRFHELGYLSLVSDNAPQIGTIRWLPDGKHLSFEYQGSIYFTAIN